jgi:hypothetical protein
VSRFRTRNFEAAQRAAERRRREDEAERLAAVVPELDSLRLEIEERRGGVALPESTHIKRVSVPHAPALFEIPCLDTWCKDGGHDVTHEILRQLRSGATQFEGEHGCSGRSGAADCQRILRYVAIATYRNQK